MAIPSPNRITQRKNKQLNQYLLNFLQNIFSVKNKDNHKVIKILGLKFSFKYNSYNKKEMSEQSKLTKYLKQNYLNKYLDGKINKIKLIPKKNLGTDKIIWQYWGQGIDDTTPPLILECLNSVDKYKGDFKQIVLTDETIKDYIDLPDFVYTKVQNETFTRTFFSDLLRVCLLSTYGGIWADATILLTNNIPERMLEANFFAYYRTKKPNDSSFWEQYDKSYFSWDSKWNVNLLSSFIIAKKNQPILEALKDILLTYWEKETSLRYYYLLHILFEILIKIPNYRIEIEPKIDDTISHYMQAGILKGYKTWNECIKECSVHKLCYKRISIDKLQNFKQKLLNSEQPLKDDYKNITFCTMCFNLNSNNLNKIKHTTRNYDEFYLKSLKTITSNYKKLVLWCDEETAKFLDDNKITNVVKKVIKLEDLPHFNERAHNLELLNIMKEISFNQGCLFQKTLTPEDIIDYATLVHTKIEIIKWAKDNNFFNSQYFYWIDAGMNNPVYIRCYKNWDGIIDAKTNKFKCTLMTHRKKIYKSHLKLADLVDIALIKVPFEIPACAFLINKDIVDEFYEKYCQTYNFLQKQGLFTTEQAIFAAMYKLGYENLFEFSKTKDYIDCMNLVAKCNNIEKVTDDELSYSIKSIIINLSENLPLKFYNFIKQKFIYNKKD